MNSYEAQEASFLKRVRTSVSATSAPCRSKAVDPYCYQQVLLNIDPCAGM